jgi:hypothetical protein
MPGINSMNLPKEVLIFGKDQNVTKTCFMRRGSCLTYFLLSLTAVVFQGILTGVNAQPANENQSNENQSLTKAIFVYTHSPAGKARFYNGILYLGYDHHPQGHPFFGSDSMLTGSVYYHNVYYPEIPLGYDLTKDIVIMPDRQASFIFQLPSAETQYFTIGTHHFIRISPADSMVFNAPATGFYEELYNGKASAFARHQKVIQTIGRADENLSRYLQYDIYYLEVKGHWFTIRNDRNLRDAFDTDAARIRDFLRKNKIRFGKDPVSAMIKACNYYKELNQ